MHGDQKDRRIKLMGHMVGRAFRSLSKLGHLHYYHLRTERRRWKTDDLSRNVGRFIAPCTYTRVCSLSNKHPGHYNVILLYGSPHTENSLNSRCLTLINFTLHCLVSRCFGSKQLQTSSYINSGCRLDLFHISVA
jgi:hypothetical protein